MSRTMNKTFSRFVTAVAAVSVVTSTAGCGSGGTAPSNVINYWLWDNNQQPVYQKCADAFEAAHPGRKVAITQYGWSSYFTKLASGFIADTGPDVFTDHVSKLGQHLDLEVLQPLDELAATKGIKDEDYLPQLAALWKGPDGRRYGVPKDWDTVAYFYNKDATAAAGVTDAELQSMTWNPDDGGALEKVLARLTVDEKGVRGDQPGFDKTRVKTYGLAGTDSGYGGFGQSQWSPYTGSIGWNFTDRNPWGTRFNFDDPKVQKTIDWYFGLAKKGFMAPFAVAGNNTSGIGADKQMSAGNAAMALAGSFMISSYFKLADPQGKPLPIGLAPTPVGPSGKRASMFNGLADVVSKQSKNPELAGEWVAFLGSDACQDIVGDSGAVFPARPNGMTIAKQRQAAAGVDITPFTMHVDDGTTFTIPVTTDAADIVPLMQSAFDPIYLGSASGSSLSTLNRQMNRLLESNS